jgi:hypothetical protein
MLDNVLIYYVGTAVAFMVLIIVVVLAFIDATHMEEK